MKKIIGCDVDGVILDFYTPFEKWCNETYPNGTKEAFEKKIRYADDVFKIRMQYIEDFWESDEISRLPELDNSFSILNILAVSHELHLATALPEKYTDKRIQNLEGLNYHSLRCLGNEKEDYVINELKPDIMFEDKPSLIESFSKAGITVYWPRFHYNEHVTCGIPFDSWSDVI